MKRRAAFLLFALSWVGCSDTEHNVTSGLGTGGTGGSGGSTPHLICNAEDAEDFAVNTVRETKSCALDCASPCDEPATPWVCPAMAAFDTLPHDCAETACGSWDGTYPTPAQGHCVATPPTGDAIAKTAAFGATLILPDGRRLAPAGKEFLFPNLHDADGADDDDLVGTFPFSAMRVPGTRWIVVSDSGVDDHVLRVLDADKLAAGENPIASEAPFLRPQSLNYGLAVASDGTVLSASGAPDSVIRAFQIDAQTGALSADTAKDIALSNQNPGDVYPSGIAVSADGKRLLVAQVKQSAVLVYSLESGDYGTKLATLDIGGDADDHFAVVFAPGSNDRAYVSLWRSTEIAELTLSTLQVKKIETGKQPEEMVFLDATHLAVANSLGDDIAIVDIDTGAVTHTNVDPTGGLHGSAPTALAFDATRKRLYVTLAARNGVAAFDVTPGSPPTLAPAGMIPTSWWPTDVLVAGDADPAPGSLFILNGKGHGTGPTQVQGDLYGNGLSSERMRGSIQHVATPSASDLGAHTASWTDASRVGDRPGAPSVSCDGSDYDFPVPRTNTEGRSKQIEHIIFIVRENKTFDAVMGDMPGVEGDPNLVMAPDAMDTIWPNIRSIAKQFAHADNFYEDAEQSIQGHIWTTYGRSTDYTERAWLTTWGRATRGPLPLIGVNAGTFPVEGGVFQWLKSNNVEYDNMGELLSAGGLDPNYGLSGIVSTSSVEPDTSLSCYMAARARSLCNLKPFTYAWYPNDHTMGASPGRPHPGTLIAVNDTATGMFIDALSHSPLWKSSLVVVVEDDPQDGGDHIDNHRSLMVMASPWVKRKYVSHTHLDIPSLHKLFAHLLGLPYNNLQTRDAMLPLDLFTSTPDYTPYTYTPLKYDNHACNPTSGKMAEKARTWDFSMPDEQPGLGKQVWTMLRNPGVSPSQLEVDDDD